MPPEMGQAIAAVMILIAVAGIALLTIAHHSHVIRSMRHEIEELKIRAYVVNDKVERDAYTTEKMFTDLNERLKQLERINRL